MPLTGIRINSTRNGSSLLGGYREDLAIGDVIVVSLSNNKGVSTYKWELIGRPEGSTAGGSGPEPVLLGTGTTASFTVDDDSGFPRDGSYVVRVTLNAGAPTATQLKAVLARVTGHTISGSRKLRKVGAGEGLGDDTSVATVNQGWATQVNRAIQFAIENSGGGGGGGGPTSFAPVGNGETVSAVSGETVVWETPVNFDDMQGTHVQFRLSDIAFVSSGSGTVRVLLGGTSQTPDGTQEAAITVTATTPTSGTNLGSVVSKPAGVNLVKLSLVPPGGQTITVNSANITVIPSA